ncbi:MAG: hypothetical protein JWP85_2816, partial [Rhodoglobus sp.]|nr:hypothetical protein [Rhodoglobus sp.]
KPLFLEDHFRLFKKSDQFHTKRFSPVVLLLIGYVFPNRRPRRGADSESGGPGDLTNKEKSREQPVRGAGVFFPDGE